MRTILSAIYRTIMLLLVVVGVIAVFGWVFFWVTQGLGAL